MVSPELTFTLYCIDDISILQLRQACSAARSRGGSRPAHPTHFEANTRSFVNKGGGHAKERAVMAVWCCAQF